jgi:hypothetical protein
LVERDTTQSSQPCNHCINGYMKYDPVDNGMVCLMCGATEPLNGRRIPRSRGNPGKISYKEAKLIVGFAEHVSLRRMVRITGWSINTLRRVIKNGQNGGI